MLPTVNAALPPAGPHVNLKKIPSSFFVISSRALIGQADVTYKTLLQLKYLGMRKDFF